MVSPRSAPSVYPHVSYTSHPYSKDVDNSTDAYSEASDHSEAVDANLEVKIMGIETEVKDLKTEVKDFKTDMKNFKTDIKDINTKIFHKIDLLGIKFDSSQKEMAHTFEKKLDSYAHDHKEQLSSYALDNKEQLASYVHRQQKEFSNFYIRCLFGVSLIFHIMYRFLTRLRSWVSRRCWSVAHGSCQCKKVNVSRWRLRNVLLFRRVLMRK
jgi:hypothetical protein